MTTCITIEKQGVLTQGYYKVVFDLDRSAEDQEREWNEFKKEVDKQLKGLKELQEDKNDI